MTPKELKAKYPNLYKLLNGLSYDNDMPFRSMFGEVPPLDALEDQASRLEGEEFIEFAIGERSAMRGLLERKGLYELDSFLLEAFDGKYQEVFYSL